MVVYSQLVHALTDKPGMVAVGLYTDDILASSRQQLKRDTACTGEQIQCCDAVEIDVPVQDVEDILLGKVCGRTCLERAWNIEVPSFVFACNDAHGYRLLSLSIIVLLRKASAGRKAYL